MIYHFLFLFNSIQNNSIGRLPLYLLWRSASRLTIKRLSAYANGQAMNTIRCVIHLSWNWILFFVVESSCYCITICQFLLNNRKCLTLYTHKSFCVWIASGREGLKTRIFHFFVGEPLPVILFVHFETSLAVFSRLYNCRFVSAAKNIITVKSLEKPTTFYPLDVRVTGQQRSNDRSFVWGKNYCFILL